MYRTRRKRVGKLGFRSLLLLLLWLTFLSAALSSEKGQTRIEVGFWGSPDWDCSPDEAARYVGAMYDIRVRILPDGKRPGDIEYAGISDWNWPDGLVINVCQLSDTANRFEPSERLRDKIQLEYYVGGVRRMLDSLWQATGQSPPRGLSAPEYHFAFRVPPELANSYLCVAIEWNHPVYGYLASEKPICTKIVAPCSEVARHKMWSKQVWTVKEQEKYDLAVALADSFMAMGWHEIAGLMDAQYAARRLGRYDDAIRILDQCFEMNHTIDFMKQEETLSAPTEADRRIYEEQRARLVELKNQQER